MSVINIQVRRRKATSPVADLVCGNADYQISFNFDSEWDAYDIKTARFIWGGKYVDVVFTGNLCKVPVITNTTLCAVGVYAGDLYTTTPALIRCHKSILCSDGVPADPPPEVYAQIMELFNSYGRPTDEQTFAAVNAWLDEHPEATTTVQDGAVTAEKLAAGSVTKDKLDPGISLGGNTEALRIIFSILQCGVFTENINSLMAELYEEIESGATDEPGGDDPGDTPAQTKYFVKNDLTNVTTSNSALTAVDGSVYTATLTAADGFTLSTVTVKMGGVDVTSTVYGNGVINILPVTGHIVITANAIERVKPPYELISDYATFELGSAFIDNAGDYMNSGSSDRLSANIEDIDFHEGDVLTIGDYTTYKFAVSTTPPSGQVTAWIGGGYNSADLTLTAEQAADMRIFMVARKDGTGFTQADIEYINANAKVVRA